VLAAEQPPKHHEHTPALRAALPEQAARADDPKSTSAPTGPRPTGSGRRTPCPSDRVRGPAAHLEDSP